MAKFPILQHFSYAHLPPKLAAVSQRFYDLAHELTIHLEPGAELSTALRKLLEAKDAAVRAALEGTDGMPLRSDDVDPVTGQRLPVGSPYSAAHIPTRLAGDPVD